MTNRGSLPLCGYFYFIFDAILMTERLLARFKSFLSTVIAKPYNYWKISAQPGKHSISLRPHILCDIYVGENVSDDALIFLDKSSKWILPVTLYSSQFAFTYLNQDIFNIMSSKAFS